MKVYSDRLAEVTLDSKGQFPCPKCRGVCAKYTGGNVFKKNWYDCPQCGRGWEVVPDTVKTTQEAERFLD